MDKKPKRDWSKYRGRNNGITTKMSLRVPNDVHEWLVMLAERQECSLSDLMIRAARRMINTDTIDKNTANSA